VTLDELHRRLARAGSSERARWEKVYMKSELRFHGCDAAELRAAARELARDAADRAAVLALVEALYATDWFDFRSVAGIVLARRVKLLEARDASVVEDLVRRSRCWAHVDHLAVKVAGPLLLANPKPLGARRARWAKDDDFWVRRLALLAELDELRAGRGDLARFCALAAPMLGEKEFFIRKAIGWVLREVAKKRPAPVRAFVAEHDGELSGLTRREATKYL
jgi:3-methyladenine DNA glycosylase AlkD